MRYLALLRGINVGGKVLRMDSLREVATGIGLAEVSIYIQTGNLIFTSDRSDRAAIGQEIEADRRRPSPVRGP